eukprot:jgi/Botrbrau1/11096/Bobra.0219s0006.1
MAKDTPVAEAEPSGNKSKKQAKPVKQAKGLGGAGLKSKKEKVRIITLEDGTEMPVGIPPGMDPAIAEQVIQYLQKDPETAKKSLEAAQSMMMNSGMAADLAQSQQMLQMNGPEYREKLMMLKDDPELKDVFADIVADSRNMEKYWNDTELMSKISAKLETMNMGPTAASRRVSETKIVTIHDAAKVGDVEALKRLLEGCADVNAQDARGVTALGVAVGFNRLPVVTALLEAGADVEKVDRRGNTVLHYAAGYGRKDAAQMLLKAGADMQATNMDGQRPIDAARCNREVHLVELLENLEPDNDSKFL